MLYIILLLVGLAAGTIGSLVGLGGGIIIVPLLLALGTFITITPQLAVGTSMITVIFTGLSSTLTYMKYKRIDYKVGLILFAGSGPGGIIGAWMNRFLNPHAFSLYFGIFLIGVAFLLLFKNKIPPLPIPKNPKIKGTFTTPEGDTYIYGFQPIPALLTSFVIGFSSGLFGIGGGSLLVPAMILLFAFPPHIAIATSMFIVFLSACVSSITHIALGNVQWLYAFALIPGAWIGGKMGAWLNTRLNGNTVIIVLRVTLIVIGVRMIWQSF